LPWLLTNTVTTVKKTNKLPLWSTYNTQRLSYSNYRENHSFQEESETESTEDREARQPTNVHHTWG